MDALGRSPDCTSAETAAPHGCLQPVAESDATDGVRQGVTGEQTEDLGLDALRRMARVWQVDDGPVVWSERRFDWWPTRHKVSVTYDPVPEGQKDEDFPAWRLVVRTALVRDVSTVVPFTGMKFEDRRSDAPTAVNNQQGQRRYA